MFCWCKSDDTINKIVAERVIDTICYCPMCKNRIWFIFNLKKYDTTWNNRTANTSKLSKI